MKVAAVEKAGALPVKFGPARATNAGKSLNRVAILMGHNALSTTALYANQVVP